MIKLWQNLHSDVAHATAPPQNGAPLLNSSELLAEMHASDTCPSLLGLARITAGKVVVGWVTGCLGEV